MATSASCRLRFLVELFGTCQCQHFGEASRFGARNLVAVFGQSVVTAALVIERCSSAARRFDNHLFVEKTLDDAVEGARTQANSIIGECGNFLDDGVAVLFTVGEGHEDVE